MYGTYFHAWDKLKLNNNNNNNNNVNQIENNNKDNIEEITSKEEKKNADAAAIAVNNNSNTNFCSQFMLLLKFWLPLGTTQLFQTIGHPFINYLVAQVKMVKLDLLY